MSTFANNATWHNQTQKLLLLGLFTLGAYDRKLVPFRALNRVLCFSELTTQRQRLMDELVTKNWVTQIPVWVTQKNKVWYYQMSKGGYSVYLSEIEDAKSSLRIEMSEYSTDEMFEVYLTDKE